MPIEVWIIVATIAGPVIAVQTQKWIERASERSQRRSWIFTTLMANRATTLSDEYVKALNLIDLNFLPGKFGRAKDRRVIEAWRALFGELCHGIADGETDLGVRRAWNQRCSDRIVDLLHAMGRALGYNFSQEELRRGIYHPQGHLERENAVYAILGGLRAILEGKESLRMKITEAPSSPELAALQAKLTERMVTAYGENGALRVRIEEVQTAPRRK